MLLQRFTENDLFSSLKDMQRIQRQLDRLLSTGIEHTAGEYPLVSVWVAENTAIVRAEMPGVDPAAIDISLINDTLTLRCNRGDESLGESHSLHRQERARGSFMRTLQLPFAVEAEKVEAKYVEGVLEIKLPRADADKPRKISVVSA